MDVADGLARSAEHTANVVGVGVLRAADSHAGAVEDSVRTSADIAEDVALAAASEAVQGVVDTVVALEAADELGRTTEDAADVVGVALLWAADCHAGAVEDVVGAGADIAEDVALARAGETVEDVVDAVL